MRGCGVLMHISSLPGPGGTGSMGKEAYNFVNFLKASGQSYWQVLPLTPPARGNSPYSSHSVFAGNPYLIDLENLVKRGLLLESDLSVLPEESGESVDFEACGKLRMKLLRKAYGAAAEYVGKLAGFKKEQSFWLSDYALFMAIKSIYGEKPYYKWDHQIFKRDKKALAKIESKLADEIGFWVFTQYMFFSQWKRLKAYANRNGIKIIGDMPIYTDADSADVWANPKVFLLDKDLRPQAVSGVPPDGFSADGQLWGNPLYDWGYLKRTGYSWWMQRLKAASQLYDVIRIDHFRALDSYYSIPVGAKTAKHGVWKKGPGIAFTNAVKRNFPQLSLIAEDLGMLTPSVHKLLEKSGLPGMKVLLFAFDPSEESSYLPHNMPRNCVAYIGTHDNDTAIGWLNSAPERNVRFAAKYLRLYTREPHWGFIYGLYESVADLVIVQMQDFLGLDGSARMNDPSTATGNWKWRMLPGSLTPLLAKEILTAASLYGRIAKPQKP